MGSAASKASRAAGGAAARKYPSRPSPSTQTAAPPSSAATQQPANLGPTVHPNQGAQESRTRAVDLDASDPVLASKLRQIGPVAANPYQSHTATQQQNPPSQSLPADLASLSQAPPPGLFPNAASMRSNPALLILQARKRLQEKAEAEFDNVGRTDFEGREFMDVHTLTDVLKMRQSGMSVGDIEQRAGLSKGVLAKLGERGVLEPAYT